MEKVHSSQARTTIKLRTTHKIERDQTKRRLHQRYKKVQWSKNGVQNKVEIHWSKHPDGYQVLQQ